MSNEHNVSFADLEEDARRGRYLTWKEETMGTDVDIFKNGGAYTGWMKHISDPIEREEIRQLLTYGLTVLFDEIALDAWADFDVEEGVRLMRPMAKGSNAGASFTSRLSQFLLTHDTDASEEERQQHNKAFARALQSGGGIAELGMLIDAAGVPNAEVVEELLSRVQSEHYLPRYHASMSLVKMAGIDESKTRYHHKKIFPLIRSRIDQETLKELENTPEDHARFAQAAKKLRRLLRRKGLFRPSLRKVVPKG